MSRRKGGFLGRCLTDYVFLWFTGALCWGGVRAAAIVFSRRSQPPFRGLITAAREWEPVWVRPGRAPPTQPRCNPYRCGWLACTVPLPHSTQVPFAPSRERGPPVHVVPLPSTRRLLPPLGVRCPLASAPSCGTGMERPRAMRPAEAAFSHVHLASTADLTPCGLRHPWLEQPLSPPVCEALGTECGKYAPTLRAALSDGARRRLQGPFGHLRCSLTPAVRVTVVVRVHGPSGSPPRGTASNPLGSPRRRRRGPCRAQARYGGEAWTRPPPPPLHSRGWSPFDGLHLASAVSSACGIESARARPPGPSACRLVRG